LGRGHNEGGLGNSEGGVVGFIAWVRIRKGKKEKERGKEKG
jgi:hypothetical protein